MCCAARIARFIRGQGSYVENLPLEGALTVTFVRSPLAHGRVTAIDATAAEALPGVQVLTGADVDVTPVMAPPPFGVTAGMERPLVATDVVRFVGEIVAIVVSEDRASGADAAELVAVDYDPLPVVADMQKAATDEVLLFPEAGTNTAGTGGEPERDEHLFDGCDVVVSGTLVSQRMAPCPLEPRSAAAEVGADGRLTAWLATQTPHQDRQGLAGMLGLEPDQVRVISPDVGGGFGAKMLGVEEMLVAWLARRRSSARCAGRRRAARAWSGSRTAERSAWASRSAPTATGSCSRIGSTSSPTRARIRRSARSCPSLTRLMSSGVYAIPRIEAVSRSVVTNTVPTSAFRGAGRPGGDAGDRAGPWTCWPPSSASTRPRSGAGTSSRRTRSRTRPRRAPSTTRATTRAPSISRCARPATTSCAPSSGAGARRAGRSSSGSA